MANLDKREIVSEVRRLLPEVKIIALTGSAAYEGVHFKPDSDIDVIAINPLQCMAWSEVGGHELVIGARPIESINQLVGNPQWHLPGWAWRVGTIARAEILYGPSLEMQVRSQITRQSLLVAASGLIGLLIDAQKKARSGRRPQFADVLVDVPLVLSELRRVITGSLPIRAEPDDDLKAMCALSDFSESLSAARTFAAHHIDTLLEDSAVAKMCYRSPNRTGLHWMRNALGINLPMPSISALS